MIPKRPFDGRKLSETYPEAHIVGVLFSDDVLRSSGLRWVLEKSQQSFASICPAFLVSLGKGRRVGESSRKGYDRGLAVYRSKKLLCMWKDNVEIDRYKDTRNVKNLSSPVIWQ